MFTKGVALDAQKLHLKLTAVSADYITPLGAIILICPLHVYAKTENQQIKKEIVDKKAHYI